MKPTVKVVEIKYPPAIGKVELMGGIRTKEAAIAWAEKSGYSTVYWLKSRERVYADKLTKAVDVLAKQIQTKSDRLLDLAEHGRTLLEYAICIAIVVFMLWALGHLYGVPW